jgi:hypothetical protein
MLPAPALCELTQALGDGAAGAAGLPACAAAGHVGHCLRPGTGGELGHPPLLARDSGAAAGLGDLGLGRCGAAHRQSHGRGPGSGRKDRPGLRYAGMALADLLGLDMHCRGV